jgi:hypothetical protein
MSDLGVDRLHAGVGEAMADRRDDALSLFGDVQARNRGLVVRRASHLKQE